MLKKLPLSLIATLSLVVACSDDVGTTSSTGATETDTGTGDGDGDTGDGDGDTGDGDGDSATGDGDGDSATGDGDGDTATGDGDGDTGPACGDGVLDDGEECDDGNPVDEDACTNACTNNVCGDGIMNMGVEGCDDGNTEDGDGCSSTCEMESCGDGIVQGPEECDDGNDVDTDECPSSCLNAFCGDGFAQDMVEECDDGNDLDTDACTTMCVAAICGDGIVQDMVEECDDANDLDTDECTTGCTTAVCGDGFLQEGVEQCDDGNVDPGDGCSDLCEPELKPNLLRCGNSSRDVATFIPMGVNLNVVASCVPDADTQAMLVTRSANFDPATIKAYVEGGGIVITEVFISDNVYNAVFNAGVGEVGFFGACLDRAPTVVQFSDMDTFWADNMFAAIPLNQSGCGRNVAGYPGLTPLAGWSMNEVSIGYRDAVNGRVWVAEFDWQDNGTQGPSYAYTEQLMGYMITTGQ